MNHCCSGDFKREEVSPQRSDLDAGHFIEFTRVGAFQCTSNLRSTAHLKAHFGKLCSQRPIFTRLRAGSFLRTALKANKRKKIWMKRSSACQRHQAEGGAPVSESWTPSRDILNLKLNLMIMRLRSECVFVNLRNFSNISLFPAPRWSTNPFNFPI